MRVYVVLYSKLDLYEETVDIRVFEIFNTLRKAEKYCEDNDLDIRGDIFEKEVK